MDESNRDLLVAVLALITDAIPRRALTEALSVWSGDRTQSLAQVLLGDSSIDARRLQALLRLAESHLNQHHGDLRTSLDSWNALGATLNGLTEIADPALKSTVVPNSGLEATLPAEPGGGGDDETLAHPDGGAETLALTGEEEARFDPARGAAGAERFRPLRLHARGGIGQVWVAKDGELQREVALKVIQDRYAERADQRARFVLEAEITGKLEHPGIVPVYSLGRNAEGRPYYAMRFIRGQSLAAAIKQFHLRWHGDGANTSRSAAMWRIEFRQLLGRFLDVCDAIDYAHSRGVLHRDLKPANIMLGRYGETLVVDWGLAKVIDRPDIVPVATGGDAEPSLTATGTGSNASDTQPGTTIGTPSYMSPEQAKGALDDMGPPSDVYSLGATLYEILTGQVAFPGKTTAEVLARVIKGDFRPPRAIVRSVPAPLEAICLKAMALERRDRYDTVRELASDLQHWLADEPVIAYPENRLQRMGRWLRRHRTWTYAAAAALLAIAVAATIGVFVVERGRRREAEARALAETNYRLARSAVEDYFTRVSEDTLLKQQESVDIRRLRSNLLKTALGYYREFLAQRSGDPEIRRDLADAQFRSGQILREIGEQPGEAIAAFKAAIAIWEDLLASAPDDREGRVQLARTFLALGEQHAWVRDFSPAFAALARSRGILTRLVAERPGDVSYRVGLADCNRELGRDEGEAGEFDRGLEHLKEAEALLRDLLSASPGDFGYRTKLARTVNGQGFIYSRQHRDAEALRAFQEFQSICQSLFADLGPGPKPAELLDALATSYYNVGSILYRLDPSKVLEPYEKALQYRADLVEAHSSVHDYREKLAVSLEEIAHIRHAAGRDEAAFDAVRKSIEILEKLVAAQPDQPRYHAELGRALNILGYLYDEARDNKRALPQMEHALAEEERAAAESPESDPYKLDVIEILQNLGEQYADLGTPDPGLPYYRKAVEVRRQMLAAHPGERKRRLALAEQIAKLAMMERHAGDSAAAERTYAEAVSILEGSPAAADDSGVQVGRGAFLMGQGLAAADRGDDARALPLLRRSIAILGPFGASATADPSPRQRLTEALWHAARLLRRAGRPDEAELRDADRRALWKDRSPAPLAALAMEETERAALVGYGEIFVSERVEAVRRLELDLAAENLRMAAALGFRDPTAFRAYPNRSLLLRRPDVAPILEDIVFPEETF